MLGSKNSFKFSFIWLLSGASFFFLEAQLVASPFCPALAWCYKNFVEKIISKKWSGANNVEKLSPRFGQRSLITMLAKFHNLIWYQRNVAVLYWLISIFVCLSISYFRLNFPASAEEYKVYLAFFPLCSKVPSKSSCVYKGTE